MIEILNKSDINKVTDTTMQEYLKSGFGRLPKEYLYPDYGYFIVVEDFKELIGEDIQLFNTTIPSLYTGLYDSINMVELNDEMMEILIFLDNDISVSFIVPVEMIDEVYMVQLLEYVV